MVEEIKIGVFFIREYNSPKGKNETFILYLGVDKERGYATPIGNTIHLSKDEAIKSAKEICDNLGLLNWSTEEHFKFRQGGN